MTEHGQTGQNVSDVVQSNRMDTNEEYVEEYDEDEAERLSRKPEAKQSPKVKRYKDDTYRCVVYTTGLLTYYCGMQYCKFALTWLP